MKTPLDNGRCFVCGPDNAMGLHLAFASATPTGDTTAEVNFPAHFQGWEHVTHGGLIATVFDEIMIKAAAAQGLSCVTGELTVKFRQPVHTQTPYHLSARVISARGKLVLAAAELTGADHTLFASAQGKLVIAAAPKL